MTDYIQSETAPKDPVSLPLKIFIELVHRMIRNHWTASGDGLHRRSWAPVSIQFAGCSRRCAELSAIPSAGHHRPVRSRHPQEIESCPSKTLISPSVITIWGRFQFSVIANWIIYRMTLIFMLGGMRKERWKHSNSFQLSSTRQFAVRASLLHAARAGTTLPICVVPQFRDNGIATVHELSGLRLLKIDVKDIKR